MHSPDSSHPGVGKLMEAWVALTSRLLAALSARVKDVTDSAGTVLKDGIIDLGWKRLDDSATATHEVPALPPLHPEQLVRGLREQVEQVLRQAADIINEDPHGCSEELTQERVQTLFRELADQVLEQAFELRFTERESTPDWRSGQGEWARRYRHMSALEHSGLRRPVH
jgi:hypothetical protein